MAEPKPIVPYVSSKDRFDRVMESTSSFETFNIQTSSIDTLLLLLKCQEEDIQVQVLDHLNRYGLKAPDNYIELFNMHLVDILLENKLYDSSYLYVQRFAFKIISHLMNITEDGLSIKQKLMKNENLFELVKTKFLTRNDHFLIEYFTILLDKFSDEPRYCDELIQNDKILEKLHRWLVKTRDTDIFLNLTRVLYKLTENPYGLVKISTPEFIPFEVIESSLRSKYPSIQISSLKLLSHVVQSNGFDKYLNSQFLDSIFTILENCLWTDLHVAAIHVIQNAMNHEDVAKKMYQNNYLIRLFNYFNNFKDNCLEVIGIFRYLAQYSEAREILYRHGLVPQLLELVQDHPTVNVTQCIGLIAEHYNSFMYILKSTIVKDLLNVLRDPLTKDWDIRTSAVNTLVILCRLDKKMCMNLVNDGASICIASFFEPSKLILHSEIIFKLITLINIMSIYEDLRPIFMTEELAEHLQRSIEKLTGTTAVLILCELINCILLYITEPTLQDILIRNNLSQWIISGLRHCQIKIKSAVNDFIMMTANYKPFCDEYVYGDVLRILLAGKEAVCDCPNWSAAINSILVNNKMVKFAIKGRLDFNDLVTDGFYCSKKHFDNFKTLIDIMDTEVSPLHPIYLVNFHHDEVDKEKCIQLLEGTVDDDLSYDRCPKDVFLPRYLEKIRKEFDFYGLAQLKQLPDYFDMSDIKKRIEVIAKLVVIELTPPALSDDDCFDHAFELHLRELKMALHCNIIPLGQLNAGGLFERALLFKVLADQVGVPCTLCLGIDNITTWNEISLYTPRKYIGITLLPRAYLESTHLVDLQNFPGLLYPINSVESWEYRKLNCGHMK